jgi:hypothetical protein
VDGVSEDGRLPVHLAAADAGVAQFNPELGQDFKSFFCQGGVLLILVEHEAGLPDEPTLFSQPKLQEAKLLGDLAASYLGTPSVAARGEARGDYC